MNCENEFCIYQKNSLCLLESVEMDINGICTSCILVRIQQELLDKLKERTLKDIEGI